MLTPEQARAYEKYSIGAVVKLVDTPGLGSGAARCESSSLSSPTTPGLVKLVNTGDLKSPAR